MEYEKLGLDVPIQEVYPSYVERYFTPHYGINLADKEGEDMRVLFHSNRICVVTLAPSHPVLRLNKKVLQVNFQTSDTVNRSDIKIKGKGKHGAKILQRLSALCKLECDDGTTYIIRSTVSGKLVEINEHLLENPGLITEKPSSEGYIAIMLPKHAECNKLRAALLTQEQYEEAISKRDLVSSQDCEATSKKDLAITQDPEAGALVKGDFTPEDNQGIS